MTGYSKNIVDIIITLVLALFAETFCWIPPQYQCTGKQWNKWLQSLHPQHLQTTTPTTVPVHYKTIYQQQVGHQPIHHPLIPVQEALLGRGPNFAIVPKYPLGNLHCTCGGGVHQTFPKGKTCPKPKPNITMEEQKAIREFKDDQSWVVLTVDKGVAMVVLDREDYKDKAQLLLADTNTYKPITKDPTNKLKNKFPKHSGASKTREDSMTRFIGKCTPPAWLPLNFMAYLKYTTLAPPLGPLSPVVVHHIWSGQGAV